MVRSNWISLDDALLLYAPNLLFGSFLFILLHIEHLREHPFGLTEALSNSDDGLVSLQLGQVTF